MFAISKHIHKFQNNLEIQKNIRGFKRELVHSKNNHELKSVQEFK